MLIPKKAAELERWLSGYVPELDYASIEQKANISTRQSSANFLGYLAEHVGNMIVSSADLANSDKTDGFLKKTHAFKAGDFTGAFLQGGVSELTLAAIMNGIALHGGVICACGTFFVFSDYMKPAVRMAALMELPVKYIWTHDSFRVGEDGPTHEPVEQEAQIRLLEEVHNFAGRPSLLALRPPTPPNHRYAGIWPCTTTHRPQPSSSRVRTSRICLLYQATARPMPSRLAAAVMW